MRTWLFNAVTAAPGLPSAFAGHIHSSGSAETPPTPFIIIRIGVEQKPLGMRPKDGTQEIPFDILVHDKPGTMVDNIDAAINPIKDHISSLAPVQIGGLWVYEIKWEETGPDEHDAQYNTMYRRVSFRATTKR